MQNTFHLSQFFAAVDTQNFEGVFGGHCANAHAILHQHFDHVGQIILAFGIGIAEFGQVLLQYRPRKNVDPCVDLLNLQFFGIGIFVLDNLNKLLVVPDNPAITCGICDFGCEQCGGIIQFFVGFSQQLQGFTAQQGHIAIDDHQTAFEVFEYGHELHNGVAGAQLLFLLNPTQTRAQFWTAVGFDKILHLFGAVADYHMDFFGLEAYGCV